jgi:outer membrane protein TolC
MFAPPFRRLRPLILLVALGTIGGCAMLAPAPDLERLRSGVAIPRSWQQADEGTPVSEARDWAHWWRNLGDSHLDTLIEQGLTNAPDVRLARARLRQARESRNLAAAGWWPGLDASVSASRSPGGGPNSSDTLYRAGFDASWEPDIFGGVRHGVAVADADLAAQAARLEQAQVSLTAEIALNYVEYRLDQERLRIACRNAASQAEILDITRWRAQAGLVTELDVEQARAALAQTRATIPGMKNAQVASLNRLDVLLGQPPGTFFARDQEKRATISSAATVPPEGFPGTDLERFFRPGDPEPCNLFDTYPRLYETYGPAGLLTSPQPLPTAPAMIAAGIPAEALYRRPDVRAAEHALAAEIARVRVTLAERFPRPRLSGSFGWQDAGFAALGGPETIVRSLAASLAASLFDGGRVRSRIGQQAAAAEQALASYEQTLLTALEDVENALSSYASGKRREIERDKAAAAARNAAQLASQMYQAGLVDFQKVLDAQRTQLSAEDGLASARGDILLAIVQLYKALGGGWTPVDAGRDNALPSISLR